MYMSLYAKTVEYDGGRGLYFIHRRGYYWPSMAVDCYVTVRS